ncbi:hypothetical protein GYMLUDRAFT_265464 [Collybiopsis luxurians FD-317 M1]|uniref:Uncharacterized protein n=1 Tax=Collybiopsis luxurians FD-317 M1 TaxID=944289 RepID=A0A0D0APU9_9AGAR|nr:hypothetical protein GYMLUDRAFT_265464 [Collybiopsis luxurians FD-317 M1]
MTLFARPSFNCENSHPQYSGGQNQSSLATRYHELWSSHHQSLQGGGRFGGGQPVDDTEFDTSYGGNSPLSQQTVNPPDCPYTLDDESSHPLVAEYHRSSQSIVDVLLGPQSGSSREIAEEREGSLTPRPSRADDNDFSYLNLPSTPPLDHPLNSSSSYHTTQNGRSLFHLPRLTSNYTRYMRRYQYDLDTGLPHNSYAPRIMYEDPAPSYTESLKDAPAVDEPLAEYSKDDPAPLCSYGEQWEE